MRLRARNPRTGEGQLPHRLGDRGPEKDERKVRSLLVQHARGGYRPRARGIAEIGHHRVHPATRRQLHQFLDRLAESHGRKPAHLLGGQTAICWIDDHGRDRCHAATFSHSSPMRKTAQAGGPPARDLSRS